MFRPIIGYSSVIRSLTYSGIQIGLIRPWGSEFGFLRLVCTVVYGIWLVKKSQNRAKTICFPSATLKISRNAWVEFPFHSYHGVMEGQINSNGIKLVRCKQFWSASYTVIRSNIACKQGWYIPGFVRVYRWYRLPVHKQLPMIFTRRPLLLIISTHRV